MFLNSLLIWSSVVLVSHAKIEQIHLSLGTNETEMVVTWIDPNHEIDEAKVYYGRFRSSLKQKVKTSRWQFRQDDSMYDIWRALLISLEPGTVYYYQIKTFDGNSEIFKFRTLERGANWHPQFAIYGDLGYDNGRILPYLTRDIHNNKYDAIFHIGDFAYDLSSDNSETGHKFMRSIEPIASRVPYMTCPGDQDQYANFSHYDVRFSMIGDRDDPNHNAWIDERLNNHYHSMDIGPAHIIMFSTEVYYYGNEYSTEHIRRQYEWLEADLERADQNRDERPWIIVMGHRPLYCLRYGDSSCNHYRHERPSIRRGFRRRDSADYYDRERKFGLEDLFHRYRVDLQFYGHDHFYARLLPIYNYDVKRGPSRSNPYYHPRGSTHIITGNAGCKQRQPEFNRRKYWVAKYSYSYGYTRLTFPERLRIVLEQVSDDRGGKVMDRIHIVKRDRRFSERRSYDRRLSSGWSQFSSGWSESEENSESIDSDFDHSNSSSQFFMSSSREGFSYDDDDFS